MKYRVSNSNHSSVVIFGFTTDYPGTEDMFITVIYNNVNILTLANTLIGYLKYFKGRGSYSPIVLGAAEFVSWPIPS
jgi:hypothetical protein